MTQPIDVADVSAAAPRAASWSRRLLRVSLYSASRLALNLAPNLITLLVLRWMSVDAAHTLLAGLAAVIFLTNSASTWVELVIFRYSVRSLARQIRQVLWLEAGAGLLLIFASPLPGDRAESGIQVRIMLALIVAGDLVYRTGLAALQIESQDRVWLRLNTWRLLVDVGLTVAAAWIWRTGIGVLSAMAVCRTAFAILMISASPLFARHPFAGGISRERWLRYGICIAAWTAILQLLQYMPQFSASRFLSSFQAAAFLAAFRMFVQSGLLATGFLLLYLHPKLLGLFHDRGPAAFYDRWRELLPWYSGVTCGFTGLFLIAYPWVALLVLGRKYAEASLVVRWAGPAIISLSLANYIQKILEVREAILQMTCYLAVSASAFVLLIALKVHDKLLNPAGLCIGLSFAFTLYLVQTGFGVLTLSPRPPKAVAMPVVITSVGAFLMAACLLYEFSVI